MDQAVRSVHKEKGFFVTEGGYEYNLALAARRSRSPTSAPARCRSTARSARSGPGPLWALAALGAGLAGPRLLERLAPAEEDAPAPAEPPRPAEAAQPAASNSSAASA